MLECFLVVNKNKNVPLLPLQNCASDFVSLFAPSVLHRDKWLCHSEVSVERGGPFVVNVSACGLAGCWLLGRCEIPSLRNSTLPQTQAPAGSQPSHINTH